ncbi:MAG: AAA family ATPase [Pseudomonadota bacterium]
MRFSKLRLTGFKSFVDPTDLLIAEGLTGVVGPNGCGKSNLLEALRWVMGESRPKVMRGGGMEDVIFAGAATRPARNFAEVALQIDNSERLAPAAFNDSDAFEIVRRITRDVGSAYQAGGKEVRARDVQMLFADASTGAHSPALVRQGQIAEVINAKPKNRRRVLEEAAGISGLYQRRHEAELKLNAAESNLARVDDVLEQLSTQLAQLARQARQAARYRELGVQLRCAERMLLYRLWREADDAREAADEALRLRVTAAAQAEQKGVASQKSRHIAEQALPPLREEEAVASAVLQRQLVARDALDDQETRAAQLIDTLSNRIAQLTLDLDRENSLTRDAGETIAELEAEAQDLMQAGEGHEDRAADAAKAAQEAASTLEVLEGELTQQTEDMARLAARHGSARRLFEDSLALQKTSEQKAAAARQSMIDSQHTFDQAVAQAAVRREAQRDAIKRAEAAEGALIGAEEARAETQALEAKARAERSEAEGELNALRAEVSALAKLVARETVEEGHLLDLVQVAPGFEKALGAALADDLRAPEVAADGPSGWLALPNYAPTPSLPEGVLPLSDKVSAPAVLQRRMSQIGLVEAQHGSALQPALLPGQRLVSVEGDLWRWDGYRAWAEDAPSAAALRLQQLNRLEVLKQALEQTSQRAKGMLDAHESLSKLLKRHSEAEKDARVARRAADQDVAEAGRALSRAEAEKDLAEARLESLNFAVTRHKDEATAAKARVVEAQDAFEELGDLDAARAQVDAQRGDVDAVRSKMIFHRSLHEELRRERAERDKRAHDIAREIASWHERLDTARARLTELQTRKASSETELAAAQDLPAELAAQRNALGDAIAVAQSRKAQAADALAAGEAVLREATTRERDAEREASDAREARAGAQARAEAARELVSAAAARIAEDNQLTPNQLLTALEVVPDQIPTVGALEAEVSRLKRQRDALGAVNLRAEQDAEAVKSEHDALMTEKVDLEQAVKALRTGIAGLNREGRERLLTAFEQVNANFSMLFTHLFGGGEANLVMVESDDPLEAGLEIMCQPPGKKLSTLSLLSGGEQTLTAMALTFAVFLSNPAPICVLDEVDAPLDDANVTRFCDLLDEMCRQTDTRFLIITHHAVTMARMDRLFGVTMAEQGVSQLVSVDLKKAETLVA